MLSDAIEELIETALKEDMPEGDITSDNIIPSDSVSKAVILAKQTGILAGIEVARKVFEKIDTSVLFRAFFRDGQSISFGDKLAELEGKSVSLLKGERTALNFLQRMSGIATTTHKYVSALEGIQTKLLDTRKTTPGLRAIEKYSVKMGGGTNHRFSLSDMVMIKDNHLEIVGDIATAVKRAKERIKAGVQVEVETTNLKEVKQALEAGADMIMLDNMSPKDMTEVVQWVNGRVPLEASGNVRLENIKEIAASGVDYISVGGLTHSYSSLDISMKFYPSQQKKP
jgi:nicotinate-nucleotide pyrophosphorylase (carboxylating)